MAENQTEKLKERMNRDQIIEIGNKKIESLVQKNVARFSSFTEDEVLDLNVGENVFRQETLPEGTSQGVRKRVICETKTILHDMGFSLEENNAKPGIFNVSLKNGGETEIA